MTVRHVGETVGAKSAFPRRCSHGESSSFQASAWLNRASGTLNLPAREALPVDREAHSSHGKVCFVARGDGRQNDLGQSLVNHGFPSMLFDNPKNNVS